MSRENYRNEILVGKDALDSLKLLPADSVHSIITSPPYFHLRDYGTRKWYGGNPDCNHEVVRDLLGTRPGQVEQSIGRKGKGTGVAAGQSATTGLCACGAWLGQLGLEDAVDCGRTFAPDACGRCYVCHLGAIFHEAQRVLHPSGVFMLNLGDCYAGNRNGTDLGGNENLGKRPAVSDTNICAKKIEGLAPGNLLLVPSRVALALQRDKWILRQWITWCKASPMPESVKGRPTCATEAILMFVKRKNYFYDHIAVRQPGNPASLDRYKYLAEDGRVNKSGAYRDAFEGRIEDILATARTCNPEPPQDGKHNLRNYWIVKTDGYRKAHFAVMPRRIPELCITAATSEKGACPKCGEPWRQTTLGWTPGCKHKDLAPVPCVVLDPFAGSGTTLAVAKALGRDYVGIEQNADYRKLIEERLAETLDGKAQRELLDRLMKAA